MDTEKILLLGSEGSMGKRYQAILQFLRLPYVPIDPRIPMPKEGEVESCSRAIIASPTHTHAKIIASIPNGTKVLCEKPLCLSYDEVCKTLDIACEKNLDLQMVNQYRFINGYNPTAYGPTFYDYFRSGQDGILLDCISIIALAKGQVALHNRSPVWTCSLNGIRLHLCEMDAAYVSMISAWDKNPSVLGGIEYIAYAHNKANDLCRNVQ